MEKLLELFLVLCTTLGFVMIVVIVASAIANFQESFKRWCKERKEKRALKKDPNESMLIKCADCDYIFCPNSAHPCSKCTHNPDYRDHWTEMR